MEIHSLAELDQHLDAGGSLDGLRLQGLDLSAREDRLLRLDPRGTVVLGGKVSDRLDGYLRAGGALVFPVVPDIPVDPYRATLYSPQELYAGLTDGYAATPDSRAYAWWCDVSTRDDVLATMLRAVHDDSVVDALHEALAGRVVVGVMGGHAVERGDDAYRQAAHLGRRLAASGALVLTGGGPGAMEAGNLGARLHEQPVEALGRAVDELAAVRSFRPDVTAWASLAMRVRDAFPAPARVAGIGVPTWFYGHEPSNVFACAVAKLFSNAVREDRLLSASTAGLVVLPGAAGTVQEVFQATTRAYYAERGGASPIVLVGSRHWTQTVPVWPLLTSLARGREMEGRIHLVEEVDDAVAALDIDAAGIEAAPSFDT